MTTELDQADLEDLAIAHLSQTHDVHVSWLHAIYWDDATSAWWLIDRVDLAELGKLVDAEASDAYAMWCEVSGEQEPAIDSRSISLAPVA